MAATEVLEYKSPGRLAKSKNMCFKRMLTFSETFEYHWQFSVALFQHAQWTRSDYETKEEKFQSITLVAECQNI